MKATSPIGRIVQGNPLVGEIQKDDKTGADKIGNDGQPKKQWWFNVAFEKANPATQPFIQSLFEEAVRSHPALFPYGYSPVARQDVQPPIHAGGCIRSDYAFKIKDGDGYDANGKPHSNKEGWKGCWIVCVSTYAGVIRVYDGLRQNAPITEVGNGVGKIKTGDFVIIAVDAKTNGWSNDPQKKPGIYMNPDLVQLVGYGVEIVGGPNVDELLGTPAAGGYVPAGMTTTPPVATLPAPMALPGSAGTLPPLVNPAPATQQLPPPVAQAAPAAQALPILPVLPNVALVNNVLAAAPVYQVTPAAAGAGYTLESLRALGHTDDVLLANGFMVKVG